MNELIQGVGKFSFNLKEGASGLIDFKTSKTHEVWC